MAAPPSTVILASRSPRRAQLLSLLVSPGRVKTVPPRNESEAGFADVDTPEEVLARLRQIAREKNDDVRRQMGERTYDIVLSADTIVQVRGETGRPTILEKPDGPDWQDRVREWFRRYYSGREHEVITGVCCTHHTGRRCEFHVTTRVRFIDVDESLLDWYLDTKESLGKAGGYGLQGAGEVFVESVQGSLSNVVGLPLRESWLALRDLGAL